MQSNSAYLVDKKHNVILQHIHIDFYALILLL